MSRLRFDFRLIYLTPICVNKAETLLCIIETYDSEEPFLFHSVNNPLSLNLDEFQFEDARTMCRNAINLHGPIAPFRGYVHLPLIAFVHPS